VVAEKNAELPADRRAAVARDVGIGAVVFFNLSSQREKDIEFDMDRVLSFEGDAGPYVQFAHARAASILRRGGAAGDADPAKLVRAEEWALAKMLSDIGDETARAADADEPHVVARYLLDVCAAFSRWYNTGNDDPSLKVLCDDATTRAARLALTAATRETLRAGLGLLGMKAPDEM
jgi:arginyl-tRNA synthetase